MKSQSAILWFYLIVTLPWSVAVADQTESPPGPGRTSASLVIAHESANKMIGFGASALVDAIRKTGQAAREQSLNSQDAPAEIIIRKVSGQEQPHLKEGGYQISTRSGKILIAGTDHAGAMYGAMDVAEQISMGATLDTIVGKTVNPHLDVRALKINLPWLPYRTGPAMDTHLTICRDLVYWQRLLDMMARNRLNVLSLWSVHPFSFMVKPTNFPEANNFSEAEMAEWKQFWTTLFRMARERGVSPYIVNWNIAVSPEFSKAYGVMERNDTSETVKRYTKEVVTQVIDEYPDLSGIGITLADWMSNFSPIPAGLPIMSAKAREDWIEETVVAGIKAAKRPVKFLHRSVLSAEPGELRRVIDNANLPDTSLVEIKFNWSHGHSTPTFALTHDSHSGEKNDCYWNPLPANYRIQWMVRNEDFFILRWGQPDFIREHIARNKQPWINGYFIGSEGYIPAKDYSHTPGPHVTWDYAFEKQWLFYELWGRLMYDPKTPDAVFEASFANRYALESGKSMLEATAAASKMPLKLASFFRATWDYTLYSEGFLSPMPTGGLADDISSFISIDELIDHATLDPAFLSIKEYVLFSKTGKEVPVGKQSPLSLADSLEADARIARNRIATIRPGASPTLECELADLETWVWLSLYFADKLRAGVALQTFRMSGGELNRQRALSHLTKCLTHWQKVSELTLSHYHEVPYIEGNTFASEAYKDALRFSWVKYTPQVKRDIELARESEAGTH